MQVMGPGAPTHSCTSWLVSYLDPVGLTHYVPNHDTSASHTRACMGRLTILLPLLVFSLQWVFICVKLLPQSPKVHCGVDVGWKLATLVCASSLHQ